MAIHVNTLNGGDITVTTGSSAPTGHAETRFTLEGGTVETYNITGTLDLQWMVANGYYDEENWEWIKNITQADIGNTVTSIGANAFSLCDSLTSVTIGNGVTSIGTNAFAECAGLASVTIPDNIESIMSSGFSDCISLTSVTITSNGGNAANVKQMMIDAGVPPNITWNMPN